MCALVGHAEDGGSTGLLEETHKVAQAAALSHPRLGFCGQAWVQIMELSTAIHTANCVKSVKQE